MSNLLTAILIGCLIIVGLVWAVKKEKNIETSAGNARKMAVAGTFYPNKKEELDDELTRYLGQTEKIETSSPIRILVVPHAGTIYSGRTAAWGYRQVMDKDFEKIMVLGVSHKYDFTTAESGSFDAWQTPFGNLEIEMDLARKLKTGKRNDVFSGEHSLEMQTIWIKKLWPKAKIVPILVSRPDKQTANNLAFRIAQNFDDKTLLIVSTDLSHYFEYEQAKKLDEVTINNILAGKDIAPESACGAEAVNIAQKVAEFLEAEKPILIRAENSGDTAGEKNKVVGYTSIGFAIKNSKIQESNFQLDENEKAEALKIGRQTLEEYVKNKKIPEIATESAMLNLPLGAFVTLRKNGELRGCIGEFEPDRPLYQVIIDKTVDAATNDHRFAPVRAEELSGMELEISVMTPRQKVKSWEEIVLGRDGVVIVNGSKSGTFLPQVATETGWSKKQFMEQLCQQKAGLPANCYLDPKTEIFVFQAQVFE